MDCSGIVKMRIVRRNISAFSSRGKRLLRLSLAADSKLVNMYRCAHWQNGFPKRRVFRVVKTWRVMVSTILKRAITKGNMGFWLTQTDCKTESMAALQSICVMHRQYQFLFSSSSAVSHLIQVNPTVLRFWSPSSFSPFEPGQCIMLQALEGLRKPQHSRGNVRASQRLWIIHESDCFVKQESRRNGLWTVITLPALLELPSGWVGSSAFGCAVI